MAHIQRRVLPTSGAIRFQVRYSVVADGKRKWQTKDFERKGEAEVWMRDQAALIERRQISGGQASVGAFIDRWLAYLEARGGLEKKTVAEYGKHLHRVVKIVGHMRLDKLSALDLDSAYTHLLAHGGAKGGPLSPRTVHHVHRILHTALKRAVRWRLIGSNVAAEAEPPSPGRSPARAPSGDELRRYLEAASATPWWCLILLAISTGLRRGELAALRWADLDLEAATLTVSQTAWEVPGAYGIKLRAKSDTSLRTISIAAPVVEELRRHRAKQAELRLAHGRYYRSDLDLVFARPGGEMRPPSELTRQVSAIARGSGLPRDVSPLHGLRHGHASAMLAEGVALKVTSARLGHSTMTITADLYQHTTQALDKAAAEAAERALLPFLPKPKSPER
jgi:integrase